jgi:hypothetical protein
MDEINKKLDRIEEVQTEQNKSLSNIDKTLALQAQQIEHHIKRTDVAEENIILLRADLKPIQKHVDFVNAFLKITAGLGSLVVFVYYVSQLIKLWFKL